MAQTSRSADLTSGPMLQKIILFSIPLAASSILQLLFIRPGHAVPVARPASCTAQLDETSLTLWACPDENGSARCRMYTDDGETSDFAAPEHWKVLELN